MGWEGEGTKEEPIVITGNNIPVKLLLSKNDYYLVLRNLNLPNLTLYRCRNITVEDCRINKLVLNRCQHVIIKQNSIMKVETCFSRANTFERNEIRRIANSNYENRYYDIFSCFSIAFGFFLLFFAIKEFVNLNFHWMQVYFLIFGSLIIVAISHFLKITIQIRKLIPNEFHNNTTISRLRQIFDQNFSGHIITQQGD